MCATRSVVEYATDVVRVVGLAVHRHIMSLLRVLEKDADKKPDRGKRADTQFHLDFWISGFLLGFHLDIWSELMRGVNGAVIVLTA